MSTEMLLPETTFPPGFLWGAATSSFQIEGAVSEGGRGVSIWDTFCREPERVKNGDTGDVACDHFHRVAEDVALMAELGLQAYRFSIAWPRIFPLGTGAAPLEAGLAFYDRLVDRLLEAGIQPWATLYHWDLPQALQDRGGWPERATCDAFVAYADAVSRRLGDRVTKWITHNEPWCVAMLGYQTGLHAPGWTDMPAALAAAHHVLLSHGMAVPLIRANSRGAQVGITVNLVPAVPASDSEADAIATRRFDGHFNRWFLDPLYGRGYPEDMVAHYSEQGFLPGACPFVEPGDFAQMAAKTDFLGINYYSRGILRSEEVSEEDNAPRTLPEPPPERCTDIGWEVWPDGLYDLLCRLRADYPDQPLYITENGAAYHTPPSEDGAVHDEARVAYFAGHVDACWRAIRDGVDLRGYFAWSLFDNFEWQEGYSQRFGLVWVDYRTQERIFKDSAHWYRATIAKNGRLT